MGRPKSKKFADSASAADVNTVAVSDNNQEEATVNDANQDDIEAVLAMINGDAPVTVAEPEVEDLPSKDDVVNDEPEGWTDILEANGVTSPFDEPEEPVAIEAEDIDAALAEIEAAAAAAEPEPTTAAKTKKAAKPKTPKVTAPAAPIRKFSEVAAMDKASVDAALNACTAKKVTEKAINVLQAIEAGKKLSRYTADALRKLKADGRVTSKALVEDYLAKGLGEGTARAQSQQMTALFKMLGIALPDPNNARELVVSDTKLVDELVKLAA